MARHHDQRFATDAATLQQSFLSAPFSDSGWTDALRQLASLTGASRAQLLGVGEANTQFNVMTDIDPAYQQDFIAIEAHRPDVNWRIAAMGDTMEVIHERQYDVARRRLRSDAYDDHCRVWGGVAGCQTTLMQDGGSLVGLATLRAHGEGRTAARDRALFAAGAHSALAAVRMQRAMAQRSAAMIAGTFETMGVAACLIDGTGNVAALSLSAEALVGAGTALTLGGRRLSAKIPECDVRLQNALAVVLHDGFSSQTQQVWVRATDGVVTSGLLCDLFRLPFREWDFGFRPRALIVIRPAGDIPAEKLAPLREALGLTNAEAEIALALTNGACREQIAADRDTSPATLKSQIKSILRKADADREAGLVALISRLVR